MESNNKKDYYDDDEFWVWKDTINKMDETIKPEESMDIIKSKYSKYSMMHATRNYENVIIDGNLCTFGDYKTDFYNEKTGEYLFPKRFNFIFPGIYMELFKDFTSLPLQQKDEFNINPIYTEYGDIGFIFPFEKIFQYYVELKTIQNGGYSKNISIEHYVYNRKIGEAIVRANKIPIKYASSLFIKFNIFERLYIADKFKNRKNNPTLRDIINLYRKNPDNKWYIRKSSLLKILKIYNNIKTRLPKLYCVYQNYHLDYFDEKYDLYNSPLDTNSDSE